MAKKTDYELEADVVETLIRDEVVGSKKWTVDKLKNSGFKSSDQGRVEDIIRELGKDPNSPSSITEGEPETTFASRPSTRPESG
ncbi:hypothetical protein [Natrinema halophilum]|uniref:Uncharacterized protein n=1 Tax=Natrinema halophilum TaxID=1699371 RepID=A0A7D5H3A0_9EURY|nr:hypothetical protein [Natrinema halophilum]QLG49691.1 hypothetical protein HYG82_12875 [Natrinema halophilum]